MLPHKHFNLRMHEDHELASLLQSELLERVTLHAWPLSCVQRLTVRDGRKMIYKSQFGPTVESKFYARASSDLLPWAQTVYEEDGHVCMLIAYVDAPRATDLHLSEAEAVRVGRDVVVRIASIRGELPSYLDLRDEREWERLVRVTVAGLRELVSRGKFHLIDGTMARDLERRALSPGVMRALGTKPGYVHQDLTGENLFAVADGYRLIDWQRPILGPTGLDLASFLESLGYDPLPYVRDGILSMLTVLRVAWCVECATKWFPEGASAYERWIARLLARAEAGNHGA